VKIVKSFIMVIDLITRADLEQFRTQLLADIRELLSELPYAQQKPWLKGTEVRELLGISAGSLQNLRISGKLKASNVGGIRYYQFADIRKVMNKYG
jgi:hypothetical protein